jgi:hypothetical protein
LRIALGGEQFELLVGLLTFIRSAHYWTLMHPELVIEDDLTELLRQHEELAGLLCRERETGPYEMGARLFEELESLRDLNERQVLESARQALELKDRKKRSDAEGGRSSHKEQPTNRIEPSASTSQRSGRSRTPIPQGCCPHICNRSRSPTTS